MAERPPRAPRSPARRFVTPEGVALVLTLGGVGQRAGAFFVDVLLQVLALVLLTVVAVFSGGRGRWGVAAAIWLLGFFLLRNAWFVLFELGRRAATPGKRLMKLRVVARDGGRLTGGAVVMRNVTREVELFLPLIFLFSGMEDGRDLWLKLAALGWTGILLLFPLFNRDRLRAGDLLAGTWVVEAERPKLGLDLGAVTAERPRRHFSEAALDLYGIFELQTLEAVLRDDDPDQIVTVAGMIRRKAGLPYDGDDRGFLEDYYAALCTRLERGAMLGRRREDKNQRSPARPR